MVWVVDHVAIPAGAPPGYSSYRLRIWLGIALPCPEILSALRLGHSWYFPAPLVVWRPEIQAR